MSTTTHSTETRRQIQHASILWCEALVKRWLPGGRLDGNEYTAINPTRDDKSMGSFRINVSSGAWADFSPAADGMRGQSPVSLYQHLNRVSRDEAIEEIGRQLGMIEGSGIKPDFSGLLASVKGGGAGGGARDAADADENECVMPVPDDAGDAPIQRGETGRWTYRNRDGKLLGYVLRFDPPGKRKWYSPFTFWKNGGWKLKHWPSPKPLYGLELLAARPDDPVLVAEGEKACDAARRHFGARYVCVAWPGGAEAADRAFWEPMRGRDALLLPDNDEGGFKGMRKAGECLVRAQAKSIAMIDALPEGTPVKWDVADAETLDLEWLDGLARSAVKEERKEPGPARRREELEIKERSVQVWEPIPVPALAELERQIGLRVNHHHPVASQQTALALAAHAVGRAFVEESGESCGLYLGMVAPADVYRGYNGAAFALLRQAGRDAEYTQERMTSGTQLYGTVAMRPNLFHVSLDFGDVVHSAKRQPYGAMTSALVALVDLYEGQSKRLEADGPKKTSKVIESPTVTAMAMFPEQQTLEVFCDKENARGTLGCFQFAWIDRERIASGSFRRNIRSPYSDDVVESFKSFRPANLIADCKGGELPPVNPTTVRVSDECEPIIDALQAYVERLLGQDRARMAGRNVRRVAAVLAAWADKENPVANAAIAEWCCRRERSRATVEAERVNGKIGDGEATAYEHALKFIEDRGKEGTTMRLLATNCRPFRKLPMPDRLDLIDAMEEDGVIACKEGNKGSKLLFAIKFVDK